MKKQRMIIWMVVASLVVIVLVALIGVLLADKRLELYNIDQVESGLTKQRTDELEKFIWQSLKNVQGFDEKRTGIRALIRPSSFSKVQHEKVTNYDFIVDIDEFKSTYEVSFALTADKKFYESPVVDCPAAELMKYADTFCKSEKTSTLTTTVGRKLPYYFHLASGQLVTVTRGVEDGGGEYLRVRVSTCGDVAVRAAAEEQVAEWVKSLGYEPERYEIRITEFCDGDA